MFCIFVVVNALVGLPPPNERLDKALFELFFNNFSPEIENTLEEPLAILNGN